MEKREFLSTVGGNVNWFRQYGKQNEDSPKNLKIELPDDLAIPLLNIYPKKMRTGYRVHCSVIHNVQGMGTN